jgi:APA family basic amino acid/polyamine antiporter
VKDGKLIQSVLTTAKILALLILITAGITVALKLPWFHQNFEHAWDATQLSKNTDGSWSLNPVHGIALMLALGTAIIGSLFSSDSWNNVTFIAGEIKNPQKNIPLSLLMGTGIVTLLYILTNIAYLGLLPLHGSSVATDVVGQGIQFAANDRVGTAAASSILQNQSVYIMALLIMISTFGCNNGIILSGARVYYAMAKEGLFFQKAANLNKNNVPAFALIIQAVWASVLCLSGTYGDLLDYCTFASLLFYIITILGLIRLRIKEPTTERPYKVSAYPFLPIIYISVATLICVILLITKPSNTWSGLFIVLLGLPVYYISRWRKRTTIS